MSFVLFLASVRMFDHPGQCELRILRGLGQSSGEIVEAAGKPRIMLAHAVHTQSDQLAREEFRERRSHGLKMRTRRDEVHVSLYGEARSGEDAVTA